MYGFRHAVLSALYRFYGAEIVTQEFHISVTPVGQNDYLGADGTSCAWGAIGRRTGALGLWLSGWRLQEI